ncbi:MAG: hypothetical protein ABIH89_05125 [Elusimicrobiota bacterium]
MNSKDVSNTQADTTPRAAVIVIGILYIIGPVIHMHKLYVDRDMYFQVYEYMGWLATVRYLFSWFQRILGIITAIGIMHFKEIYRKILICICLFTIITVYWKHHYPAFLEHTKKLDQKYGFFLNTGLSYETITVISIIVHSLLNVVFCVAVIYCLTRPSIKKVFHK